MIIYLKLRNNNKLIKKKLIIKLKIKIWKILINKLKNNYKIIFHIN